MNFMYNYIDCLIVHLKQNMSKIKFCFKLKDEKDFSFTGPGFCLGGGFHQDLAYLIQERLLKKHIPSYFL